MSFPRNGFSHGRIVPDTGQRIFEDAKISSHEEYL